VSGDARESVRQPDRPVIELDFGILVYPPEADGEPWRAVFTENGQRKYRQGATEAKLAAKLVPYPGSTRSPPPHISVCGHPRLRPDRRSHRPHLAP